MCFQGICCNCALCNAHCSSCSDAHLSLSHAQNVCLLPPGLLSQKCLQSCLQLQRQKNRSVFPPCSQRIIVRGQQPCSRHQVHSREDHRHNHISCPSVPIRYEPDDPVLCNNGGSQLSFPPPPTIHLCQTPPLRTMHAERHAVPWRTLSGLVLLIFPPLIFLVLILLVVTARATTSHKSYCEGWWWGGGWRIKWRIAPRIAHFIAPEGTDEDHGAGTLSTVWHTSPWKVSSVLTHSPYSAPYPLW